MISGVPRVVAGARGWGAGMGKLSVILASLLVCTGGAQAQGVPRLLNYQGKLTDGRGSAVSGQYAMVFRLYDQVTGGSLLWSESLTVSVRGGVFNVVLGQVNPVPAALGSSQLYLEAAVGGVPLLPRTALGMVPYALAAAKVDTGGVDALALAPNSVGAAALGSDSITTTQVQGGAVRLDHVTVSASPLPNCAPSVEGTVPGGLYTLCTLAFNAERETTVLLVAKVASATHRCTGADDLVGMSSYFRVEADTTNFVLEATDGGTVNTEVSARRTINSVYLARPVTLSGGAHTFRLKASLTTANCTEGPGATWAGASLALHPLGVTP